MVQCCACFGPNDSYLFNSPTRISRNGLPTEIEALINNKSQLRDVYELALGPDGSYAGIYEDVKGMLWFKRSNIPAGLENWLCPNGKISAQRDLGTLQITLGPNKSYFAFDKKGSCWGNLPANLQGVLARKKDARGNWKANESPQSMSLGANGTYVYTTVGGGGSWNLGDQPETLNQFLKSAKSLKNLCVILSPCRTDIFMLIHFNGGSQATVPSPSMANWNVFSADWKSGCDAEIQQQRQQQARQRQVNAQRSANIGRNVVKGIGLLSKVLIAANGGNNGGGGGGGGGGGFDTNNSFPDMSGFWQPIQSAASDPIQ